MQVLDFLFHIVYKLIYYYSCIEIFLETKIEKLTNTPVVKKITKNVSEFMHYRYPVQPPIQQYLFIEDGNQVLIYKGNDPLLSLLEPESYDFIIRNDYCKQKKWINNKIIYQTLRDCGDYTVSTESLLSFVVYYGTQIIEIQLCTDTYNYMIVGNIIDKKFIYYLLKNMGISVGILEDFTYTIQIVTSRVDILYMNSTQKMVVQQNGIVVC